MRLFLFFQKKMTDRKTGSGVIVFEEVFRRTLLFQALSLSI